MDIEIEHFRSLKPSIADVVRVPNPRHGLAGDGSALLDKSKNITQDLAGMVFICEPVDYGNARMRSKPLDNVMLERTDHDDVNHTRNHPSRIFHRFTASQLGVPRRKINRCASELVHACLERHPGTSRVFVKNHRKGTVFQRPIATVVLELPLDPPRTLKHMLEFLAGKIIKL